MPEHTTGPAEAPEAITSPSGTSPEPQHATGDIASGADESRAGELKDRAQDAASTGLERAREAVRRQVDERSSQAGSQIGSMADDLRAVSQQLRERDNSRGAEIADDIAGRAERTAGYLADSDADRILRDAEDFGRRQPWLVLAGGIALGVAAARMLKASSTDRYRREREQSTPRTAAAPPRIERETVSVEGAPPVGVTSQPSGVGGSGQSAGG